MAQISDEAYSFLTKEVLQVHALCDRAQVPREIDAESLSMAQRVSILEGVQRGLTAQLGVKHPINIH
mgnify:CR=1 FL=1|jgi:hypothetical protein